MRVFLGDAVACLSFITRVCLYRPRPFPEAHRIKVAAKVTGEYASVKDVAPPVAKAAGGAAAASATAGGEATAGALILHEGEASADTLHGAAAGGHRRPQDLERGRELGAGNVQAELALGDGAGAIHDDRPGLVAHGQRAEPNTPPHLSHERPSA